MGQQTDQISKPTDVIQAAESNEGFWEPRTQEIQFRGVRIIIGKTGDYITLKGVMMVDTLIIIPKIYVHPCSSMGLKSRHQTGKGMWHYSLLIKRYAR